MTTADNPDLKVVFVDPDDDGFYKSRARQWAAMCPHMNSTEYRVYVLLCDLCSERATFRKVTLAEIGTFLPSGKTDSDGNPKPASVSTVANAINALAAIGQITDPDGNAVRVSNKTRGDLRLAPWRSLQHDCTASRNIHDALARTRDLKGDDGPRWPVGLGSVAQNSVPDQSETPATSSGNREESISPSSTSSSTPTHTPGPATATSTVEPKTETSVCVDDQQRNTIAKTVRVNVIDRAHASVQTDHDDPAIKHAKIAIFKLAIACFEAGATIEAIDTALSSAINSKTTHPYTHGTDALNKLLAHKRDNTDPLGATKTEDPAQANPWIDPEDGQEWPHRRLDNRPCGGQACDDVKGKKYVAVKEQLRDNAPYDVLGAVAYEENGFTCETCKEAYKKEGLLT